MTNLFEGIAPGRAEETFDVLAQSAAVRVERIVSTGQATPPGEWLAQERDEWVVVLRGRARLRFEDIDTPVVMGPGDHVTIPAHRRHRVEWTDPEQATVWLAVHY